MQDRKSTSRGPLLLAGLAAALGGLTGACGYGASPAASPTPASQGDLAYYSKDSFASVNVIDWSGELQNVIQLPQVAGAGSRGGPPMLWVWRVSPDGSRVLLSDGRVTDRYGTTVGRLDPKAGFGQRWADDNRHLCELTIPEYSTFSGGTLSGPVALLLVNPGAKPQLVASVGTDANTEYVEIRACSVRNDRAVVVQLDSGLTDAAKTGLVATTELKVLRLSTGQVLFRQTYSVSSQPQGATEDAVSDDGLFVAETFRIVRGATSPTIIRDLTTGTPVAALGPFPNPTSPSRVHGFTGDATRLIVSIPESSAGSEIRALDWRLGRVAWRISIPGGLQVLLPKPYGSAVLLVANDTLWLISADGVPRQVSSGIEQLWSNEQW